MAKWNLSHGENNEILLINGKFSLSETPLTAQTYYFMGSRWSPVWKSAFYIGDGGLISPLWEGHSTMSGEEDNVSAGQSIVNRQGCTLRSQDWKPALNSYSASHDNWCTATLWKRIMTAQCEGMGEVGSARYEPALLPPCPSIRALSYSNCQRSTHSNIRAWQCKC